METAISISENGGAPGQVTELAVGGMNCANCARHVTEALEGVPGVSGAQVRLDEGRATVRWQAGTPVDLDGLLQAVSKAGYQPSVVASEQTPAEPATSPMAAWKFNVILGAVLTVPMMIGEWFLGLGPDERFRWVGFALATPVMLVCGRRFFVGAWQQLKRGRSNMDTLVALGSTTAYGYSLWGLLAGSPGHLYFMESAAIITLISTGHWLEARVGARAADAVRALMSLAPATARRLETGGQETEVPVASLRAGAIVVLRPGDRIPVDGVVVEGDSTVDESMLTGESQPVEKSHGARLYAGTLNQNGRILMRVTATGEATALAHIIAVVQRAQSSRASIQRLGDRISSVFVPVVVLVALATGLWWGLSYDHAAAVGQSVARFLWPIHLPATATAAAFAYAAGVLIVACPCAMGLATPVAIMAGANAAAQRGILIRDGEALEKSGRITAVLFDKTRTLTHGKLTAVAVEDLRPSDQRAMRLPEMAAALARPSTHPLSQAVATWADTALFRPHPSTGWQEHRGRGVEMVFHDSVVRLGSLSWLGDTGVDVRPGAPFVGHWTSEGATVLGMSRENQLVAVFALGDQLKPHAAAVVKDLMRSGLRVYLVSGDQKATAAAVALKSGIPETNVFAEVRPEQKAGIVADLQARGERVAFVGDGINDAPALEAADLGIAVGEASDVAREAADMILLKSDIQAIPEALGLARAALRTIRQNLFWAFFYNAAAVPLAALGFLSPVLCAAAMGFSDLIVIGNALRLRYWRH